MSPAAAPTSDQLALDRTKLALDRTVMAAGRTLMAWVRTGLSPISLGFAPVRYHLVLAVVVGVLGLTLFITILLDRKLP